MRAITGDGVSLLLSGLGGLIGLVDHEPLSDTTIFPSISRYNKPRRCRKNGQSAHFPPDAYKVERETARALKLLN